jgi:hypothetical protein
MREFQRAVVKRCDQANKSFMVYSGTATPPFNSIGAAAPGAGFGRRSFSFHEMTERRFPPAAVKVCDANCQLK